MEFMTDYQWFTGFILCVILFFQLIIIFRKKQPNYSTVRIPVEMAKLDAKFNELMAKGKVTKTSDEWVSWRLLDGTIIRYKMSDATSIRIGDSPADIIDVMGAIEEANG